MEQLYQAVAALSDRYQPIYRHDEYPLMEEASYGDCLEKIRKVYIALRESLGRTPRVLDLGCAQGFNTMTVASWGAEVTGVDPLEENIRVCKLLAEEYKGYHVSFVEEKVETFLAGIGPDTFDLVLGLNVLQYLCEVHGAEKVREMMGSLARRIPVGIFEMPLRDEPFSWAEQLPADYKQILSGYSVVKTLMRQEVSLSKVKRPLCFVSNSYLYFASLGLLPLDPDQGTPGRENELPGRRIFYSGDKAAEYVDYRDIPGNRPEANKRLGRNALEFLSATGGKDGFPRLFALEENGDEIWALRGKIPGRLLESRLPIRDYCDPWDVIRQTLEIMIFLEESGYCHRDFGLWNVRFDEEERRVYVLGYGAVEKKKDEEILRNHPVMAFLSFMCQVLGENRDPQLVRSTEMLTRLKGYLTDLQYVELAKLRGRDISFHKLRDILFSGKRSGRPYAYTLRDMELLSLTDTAIETRQDWEALKPVLVDRINKLLAYRKESAEIINRLSSMLQEQQTRIQKLEEQLQAKE